VFPRFVFSRGACKVVEIVGHANEGYFAGGMVASVRGITYLFSSDLRYNTGMRKSIADQLRAEIRAAERRGVSQYSIAAECGISRAALSRFMAGLHGLRLDNAEKIASVIGITLKLEKTSKQKISVDKV
jgi:hypothetical protein